MLLRQNGIDPAVLLPPQLQLFRIAGTEQQDRLLQLWRICPPTKNDDILMRNPSLAWTATTLEQEEDRTRQRVIQHHHNQTTSEMEQRTDNADRVMSLDGTTVQAFDGSWAPSYPNSSQSESEPYMLDGYMQLMQKYGYDPATHSSKQALVDYAQATDPVYRSAGWHGHGPAGMQMEQMDVAM